jgi:CRP/FNR family transcriptional regulator, anaerobic regulatory protein
MPANLARFATTAHLPPAQALPKMSRDLAALDQVGMVVSFAREQTIFCEGDAAEYYYKVVSGAVRSCRLLADGRRYIADFFLPGDFVGLGGDRHLFTAEAVSDTTLVRYARRSVDRLIGEQPRLGRCFLAMLSAGLCTAQTQMLLLGRKTAQEKIASFLLAMAERTGTGDAAKLPMTRTDIGDYLGLTTETVSRSFTQLRHDGVIALNGLNEVRILDHDMLVELAGEG